MMEKTVQELKMIIRDLILEVGDLKERVTELEKSLVRQETENNPEVFVKMPESMSLEGESYENLGKLYKEGFHVCPMAFGQIRRDECLFCVSFMEKE